jgi:hypothetical protein
LALKVDQYTLNALLEVMPSLDKYIPKVQKSDAGVVNVIDGLELLIEEEHKIGREEGIEKGDLKRLISLIDKKLLKHKTREQIIDELEIDASEIDILDNLEKYKELLTS